MEKCEHSSLLGGTFWDLDGCTGYYAMCGVCCLYGTGKTAHEVLEQFYPKEKTMSTDYDAGYKAGVNAALDLPIMYIGKYTAEFVKKTVETQRKKLLTKKVTKWVIVTYPEHIANGRMFDTEKHAKVYSEAYFGGQTQGVFPLEIEIPL